MTPITLEQAVDLAISHQEAGRFQQAADLLQHITRAAPDWPAGHNQLGIALQQLGRHDAAVQCFNRALAIDSNYAAAYGNLATSLSATGQRDKAVAAAERCAQMIPDVPEAWCNLGNLLRDAGRLSEALVAYRNAIERRPGMAAAHSSLGNVLKDLGEPDAAVASFRRAIELLPGYHAAWSNLLYTLHFSPTLEPRTMRDQHIAWADSHADPLSAQPAPHPNEPLANRRLRIGLVSPDLREHPVGRFILPLLREYDRRNFEIVCYADIVRADLVSEQLRANAAQWVESRGLDDAQLADRVRADRIDILVDLAGHTADNRLLTFARKPAPVQVSYLGYPDTTGLAAMDYRIVDAVTDPPGDADALCREKLIRLPDVGWCFDAPPASPDVSARTDRPVTFGCFNTLAKINAPVLAAWSRILSAVPGSRMVIKASGATDADVATRLRAGLSVDPDRIELRTPLPGHREHLDAYNDIDIALDPFPYCGTMTTCEAMWMGVPVITLAGRSHVGRVGASLATAVGLTDLIAHDTDHYIARAVELASDATRRAELRLNLRRRMRESSLMDASTFARNFESAVRTMWRDWCASH